MTARVSAPDADVIQLTCDCGFVIDVWVVSQDRPSLDVLIQAARDHEAEDHT